MPSKRTNADASLAASQSPLPEVTRAANLNAIIVHPFGDPAADIQVELVRPDDLLSLHFDGYNLRLDTSDSLHPQLVRKDGHADAYLVVKFPPQSLLERAYFEVNSPLLPTPKGDPPPLPTPPGYPPAPPLPPPVPAGSETPCAPGALDQARLAGSSRLVFRVPVDTTAIPYSTEGLLDWSSLELAVSPVAAMPESPSAEQLRTAPAITRPGLFETAIEMPYRLVLSPGPDATWLHAREPVSHAGRTELWHTRMALKPAPRLSLGGKQATSHTVEGHSASGTNIIAIGGTSTAPVRAIWSPDYLPADQHMPDHSLDLTPFRAPMTARDRHQIVVLTSAFSDYYTGPVNSAQPYLPTPVHVQRLMLSSLGGWLSSRGSWGPDDLPYSGVAPHVTVPWYLAPFDFARKAASWVGSLLVARPSAPRRVASVVSVDRPNSWQDVAIRNPISPGGRLDLSEWVHLAAQGRDHYVRIVYEGYLYPFGHRAALIKVTERKFQAVPSGPLRGAPAAYLRQHMYIVVREPEKTYGDALYSANTYRQMPLKPSIRLTTLVTPNIDPPALMTGTGSFWVRVNSAPFNFHVVARDVGGHESDYTAALIFVPFSDVPVDTSTPGSSTPLGKVRSEYMADDDRRRCAVPGKKVAYAPGATADAEDTTLATTALYFDTQPTGTTPSHFLPILEKAEVTIPALKQITGATGGTTITIYDQYVNHGAPDSDALSALHGVFATTASPVDVTFAANRAGGFATPNLGVTALSRTHGPVGGTVENAARDLFDPSTFFPPSAQLFGAIPLASLIPTGNISTNAPRVTTHTDTAPDGSQQIVTQIAWAPPIQAHAVGPVTFTPGDGSTLTILGTITTPVGAPQASGGGATSAGDPGYQFKGTLTSFSLDLLKVISIQFKSFGFASASGQKVNVSVQLEDPSSGKLPVAFEGPLAFVNALSQVIPQGGFGDEGPHIDVTPQQVEVGYTLGLPVVNIGVFALKDVTIAAGLDLPFTSGKPQVDFAFASRNHPFILTVECLGGGGFVHVQLTTEQVTVVEGQLEFGGDFSLDVGVASGGVHIMAGIYFKLTPTGSDLTGFVDAGGELSVLGLISVSLDFYLSLSYQDKTDNTTHPPTVRSKVRGRATLTVAVHVAFFSTSVDVTVDRSYGDAPGDPGVADVLSSADWEAYAKAFA